ncbi:hypothetical protein BGZ76_003358, partial [Entomortierella beljakovae]
MVQRDQDPSNPVSMDDKQSVDEHSEDYPQEVGLKSLTMTEPIQRASKSSNEEEKLQNFTEGHHLAEGVANDVAVTVAKLEGDIDLLFSEINSNTAYNMVSIQAANTTDVDDLTPAIVALTNNMNTINNGTMSISGSKEVTQNALNGDSSSKSGEDHRFFTRMLSEIDNPTIPYGFSDVQYTEYCYSTSYLKLSQGLNNRLRGQAKKMGLGLASL